MNYKNLRKCLLMSTVLGTAITTTQAQSVRLEWAGQFSGANSDEAAYGYGIAVDASQNSYTVGSFSGTVNFNPGGALNTFTSLGGMYFNAFITKLDASGKFVWARQLGGANGTEGFGIALDPQANVYTTGYFQGDGDFDPGSGTTTLSSGSIYDAASFISKLDSSGKFVWAKKIGGGSWVQGISIATDEQGNIYSSGQYDGTLTFDGISTGLKATGDNNVYIIKVDPAGKLVWAKQLGTGSGYLENRAIKVDHWGNVLSTGLFSGTGDLDFDPGAGQALLAAGGSNSTYISKLDSDGNYIFAKQFSGSMGAMGNALSVDEWGNIFTAGIFMGTVDFDPGTGVNNLSVTATGFDWDVFVSKLDSGGNFQWARKLGSKNFEDCKAIGLDRWGQPYITGYFSGTLDFDPGTGTYPLTALGSDMYVAKLDTAGNFVWAKNIGRSTLADDMGVGRGIVIDPSSNVYTTGSFTGAMDFDPGDNDLIMNGGQIYSDDAFVHKMICADTSSSRSNLALCQDSLVFLQQTLTSSGTYTFRVPNHAGCDSTITLNLQLQGHLEKPVIAVKGFELSTTTTFPAYQWLQDGAMIPGATQQTYQVTQNGLYSVIVKNEGECSDTANAYEVKNVGITGGVYGNTAIQIGPNPFTDWITVTGTGITDISIITIEGKLVLHTKETTHIPTDKIAPGIYWLQMRDAQGRLLQTDKIVKQ